MQPETAPDELLNVSQLARRLGRSPEGIKQALHRLGIEPTQTLPPRQKLYPANSTCDRLEKEMRQANQSSAATHPGREQEQA